MISRFYALHGFLGRPQDFSELSAQIPGHWCLVDYLREPKLKQAQSLPDFGRRFNDYVRTERAEDRSPAVLVGYSLGGRLALHAFFSAPELWSRLILISSHLGLETEAERQSRLQVDQTWLSRFQKDNFIEVLNDWNAQPVFVGGRQELERHKEDYSAEDFDLSLRTFSLSQQSHFLDQVNSSDRDILYVCGQRDSKYVALSQKISGPRCRVQVIPSAGHRVLFDQPKDLVKVIQDFLAHRPGITLKPF